MSGLFDRKHHVTTEHVIRGRGGYRWRCLTCRAIGYTTQSSLEAEAEGKRHAKPQPRRR
ncbi:hypothetical protein [Streptomyces decoyicus]|uniref:hypothetical protein n=1 Tax=Streptomyces decoyicus TaxID=249567 RepID=UPI00382D7E02